MQPLARMIRKNGTKFRWGMCETVLGFRDPKIAAGGALRLGEATDVEMVLLCRGLSTCFKQIIVRRVGRSSFLASGDTTLRTTCPPVLDARTRACESWARPK